MKFDLAKSVQILERTPVVLEDILQNVSDEWTMHNEGGDTWSSYDIVGHLIHVERTNWMERLEIILHKEDKKFIPLDRFAQFKESEVKSLQQLLSVFSALRKENLQKLKSFHLTEDDLNKTGIHPEFGDVTLRQLLSTWTIHDLTHIAQITRVMAKQYKEAIGPWIKYFRVMQ